MDGVRFSLILPGRSAGELIPLARSADLWNLAALWVGDPAGAAPNSDDSYVMTTAAALAAVTQTLRLGVFVTLRGSASPVRLADDIGVVDQMSNGRLELGLVADAEDPAWTDAASGLLGAWNGSPLGDSGDTVGVTPQPAQPMIPRAVVGSDELAAHLGAGSIIAGDDPRASAGSSVSGVRRRIVRLLELDLSDGVQGWLATDPYGRILELRGIADEAGATELALVVGPDQQLTASDVKALGIVVVPCLRGYAGQVHMVVNDAWMWLTERAHLHEVPA